MQIIQSTLQKELTILDWARSATLEITDGAQTNTKRELPNPFKWADFDAAQVGYVKLLKSAQNNYKLC